jgi:hypothetical protein
MSAPENLRTRLVRVPALPGLSLFVAVSSDEAGDVALHLAVGRADGPVSVAELAGGVSVPVEVLPALVQALTALTGDAP